MANYNELKKRIKDQGFRIVKETEGDPEGIYEHYVLTVMLEDGEAIHRKQIEIYVNTETMEAFFLFDPEKFKDMNMSKGNK